MVIDVRRQQGEDLLAQRVKDAGWDGRHERSTTHGALAPSRAWPSCLPPTLSHADRNNRAYWRALFSVIDRDELHRLAETFGAVERLTWHQVADFRARAWTTVADLTPADRVELRAGLIDGSLPPGLVAD